MRISTIYKERDKENLAERLLKMVDAMSGKGKSRGYKRTTEKRAHGEKQAEQWLVEGLEAAGLETGELERLPGSHARKAALAELLWSRTTVSQEWRAERLLIQLHTPLILSNTHLIQSDTPLIA